MNKILNREPIQSGAPLKRLVSIPPSFQDGLVFRCGGEYCFGRTFPDLLRVTTHLRKFHCS
ncbi:unnamed protein product, partial [Allacma fusca]